MIPSPLSAMWNDYIEVNEKKIFTEKLVEDYSDRWPVRYVINTFTNEKRNLNVARSPCCQHHLLALDPYGIGEDDEKVECLGCFKKGVRTYSLKELRATGKYSEEQLFDTKFGWDDGDGP